MRFQEVAVCSRRVKCLHKAAADAITQVATDRRRHALFLSLKAGVCSPLGSPNTASSRAESPP